MTTDHGRAFILMRLSECPTLAALRTVWNSIAFEYQRDPVIQKHKEDMKAVLK